MIAPKQTRRPNLVSQRAIEFFRPAAAARKHIRTERDASASVSIRVISFLGALARGASRESLRAAAPIASTDRISPPSARRIIASVPTGALCGSISGRKGSAPTASGREPTAAMYSDARYTDVEQKTAILVQTDFPERNMGADVIWTYGNGIRMHTLS